MVTAVAVCLLSGLPGWADQASVIERARDEQKRVEELASIGAVSKARLEQAREQVLEAEDDEILRQLLYGNVGVENLSESQTKQMVEAAQRRVDRVAKRFRDQSELVAQGVLPKGHVEEFERQLADRRLTLQLAENRARIFEDLLNMAKAEEIFETPEDEEAADHSPIQSYAGSGVFKETHLTYVAGAFEKQFRKPLPVSAKGQTALHTFLGFDHSGKVDVAVNPDDAEGVWLRSTLESLRIPYIALRATIAGKSTGPHIHVGLPSSRLRTADAVGGAGQH